MADTPSSEGAAPQAPPAWWSPTHGLIEVAHKRWPDEERRLVRITDRRVIELPNDAIELRPVPAPAPPTLAETRTGHDWCPHCKTETGTDRFTYAGVERCAVCSKVLVPAPAVDREGLGHDVVTEHAIEKTDGSMQVRNPSEHVESVYPLSRWIPAHQRFGGKVWRRRIRVVEDWVEVPKGDGDRG